MNKPRFNTFAWAAAVLTFCASAAQAKAVGAALSRLAIGSLRFEVSEIAVVQSVLSPKGPRYTALATVPLAHR